MSQETDNKLSIAVLQEKVTVLTVKVDKLTTDQETLIEEIQTVTTAIKTGKWILVSIFFIAGAVSHKSWNYIANLLSN
jgi:hypothetical protein